MEAWVTRPTNMAESNMHVIFENLLWNKSATGDKDKRKEKKIEFDDFQE